jgi:hypothetical protein
MPIVPSTTLRLAGLGLGSTEAAWRLVRGSSFRRVAGATTPPPPQQPSLAQLLLVLHLLSPSSQTAQHTLLPAIGTVAHPQLPINPGLHTACTEVVCARGGVVSTTLARDSKVTRCLLCNCHRGFRISKATAEPQFDPPEQEYPSETSLSHDQAFSLLPQQHQILSLTSNVFAMKAAGV